MATKAERAVVLPESIYNKIVRIAKEEDSNIPWVTRQLLAKAMADLKGKPEWFYEIEEQIEGLRNETLVVERAKVKKRTAMHLEGAEEQLLEEIKKQIEGLRREIGEVREETRARLKEQKPRERVSNRFATRHLLANALVEERGMADRADSSEKLAEMQRDLEWLRSEVQAAQRQSAKQGVTGEELFQELRRQIEELKEAVAEAPGKKKVKVGYEEGYEFMLWPELDEEPAEEVALGVAEENGEVEVEEKGTFELLYCPEPDAVEELELELEQVAEPEQEPVEEIESNKPGEKGKVLRPFFGRLTAMFSSVLG